MHTFDSEIQWNRLVDSNCCWLVHFNRFFKGFSYSIFFRFILKLLWFLFFFKSIFHDSIILLFHFFAKSKSVFEIQIPWSNSNCNHDLINLCYSTANFLSIWCSIRMLHKINNRASICEAKERKRAKKTTTPLNAQRQCCGGLYSSIDYNPDTGVRSAHCTIHTLRARCICVNMYWTLSIGVILDIKQIIQ